MVDMVYRAEQVLKLTSEGTPHKSRIPIPFSGLTDSTYSNNNSIKCRGPNTCKFQDHAHTIIKQQDHLPFIF